MANNDSNDNSFDTVVDSMPSTPTKPPQAKPPSDEADASKPGEEDAPATLHSPPMTWDASGSTITSTRAVPPNLVGRMPELKLSVPEGDATDTDAENEKQTGLGAKRARAVKLQRDPVSLSAPSREAYYIPQALSYPTPGGTKRPTMYVDTPLPSPTSPRSLRSPYNTLTRPVTWPVDRTDPEEMNEATSIDLEDRLGDRLTDRQRHMALLLRATRHKTSLAPAFYFLLASLGKLLAGYGASLAIKGHFSTPRSDANLYTGIALAAVGMVGVVIAALGFGAAVQHVNKRLGVILKCISISAGAMIAAGYAINQYLVSEHKPLSDVRLSWFPLMLGTGALTATLPNFTAYTELCRGRVKFIPNRRRPLVAMLLMGPALGSLFAGWVTGEHANWWPGFNASVLTISVAMLFAGISIFWANHLRREAEWADCVLQLEEEHTERHKAVRALDDSPSSSKGGDSTETTSNEKTEPAAVQVRPNADEAV